MSYSKQHVRDQSGYALAVVAVAAVVAVVAVAAVVAVTVVVIYGVTVAASEELVEVCETSCSFRFVQNVAKCALA